MSSNILILCLSILALIVLITLWRALVTRTLPLTSFPFIFIMSTTVFIGPQIYECYYLVNHEVLTPTILYITLCMVMLLAGCNIHLKGGTFKNPIQSIFNEQNLALYSICFIILASVGLIKLWGSDTSSSSQFSGKDVMYNFLFTTYRYALIFASVGYFKTRRKIYKFLIILSVLFFIDRIFIAGRRTDLVYLAIGLGIPYIYYTKAKIKLVFIIPAIILAFEVLSLLVAVRTATLNGAGFGSILAGNTFPSILQIQTAQKKLNKYDIHSPELNACIYGMRAISQNNAYDYGAGYWNAFIQDFVPAQIVGGEFKASLKIQTKNAPISDYKVLKGSTMTGFYDSFMAFGYLGCMVFFLIGWFMSALYRKAMNGDTFNMIFYLCVLVDALHAVTHRTSLFISGILMFIVFLLIMKVLFSLLNLDPNIRSIAS